MNLSAQFKQYLLTKKNPASKVTVKNYVSDVNRFIAWFEAKLNIPFDPNEASNELINVFKKESLEKYSASSVDRSLSSIRKFFTFLKIDGEISHSPFESDSLESREKKIDTWRIKDFKNYLYVLNASSLTIKNYIIDVNQFKSWVEGTIKNDSWDDSWDISESNIVQKIDSDLINDYKNRLLNEMHLSPVSVNRKLSSLRRYTSWLTEEGMIKPDIQVLNTPKPTAFTTVPIILPTENAPLNQNIKSYSKFPPLRLLQKTSIGINGIFDVLVIAQLAKIMNKFDHAVWVAKGKPVFEKSGLYVKPESSILTPVKSSRPIKNIPKSFYAPTKISTANFPLHRKIWHKIRYSRPKWYRKYHSYRFISYFHLSILMIVVSLFSYVLFNNLSENLNPKKNTAVLAALPSAPARVLSFQGRLTDAETNPINQPTTLRMAIYTSQSATGSALLWQEINSATPDSDGVFNVVLGKSTPIPSTVFAQNSALWLGVTVENTKELAPRQPIATVAFASNSETLQGLPPITNSNNTANVVLALNSSGNLTIGGSASPIFQATGGRFTIAGRTLLLTTTTASNGNVVISPNGTGIIDMQKVIQNTTNNGTIVPGSVQVDDILLVNTSTTTNAILGISQGSTGDLIIASTSGSTKFRVDNAGTITASGSINGLSVSSGTISSGTWTATQIGAAYGGTGLNSSSSTGVAYVSSGTWSIDSNSLAPNHGGTGITSYTTGDLIYASADNDLSALSIGGNGTCLTSDGTIPSWGTCSGGSSSIWTESNGLLYASNTTQDFLIGSSATSSADFAILNVNGSEMITATISGNLVVMPKNGNGGKVGIGTTPTDVALDIFGPSSNGIPLSRISDGTVSINTYIGTGGANAQFGTISNHTLYLLTNNKNTMTLYDNSQVGIGTSVLAPLATLDIRNTLNTTNGGTLSIASISGSTSFAALVADNSGEGDLFTASKSGETKFVITNTGNIGIGVTNPIFKLDLTDSQNATAAAQIFNTSSDVNADGLIVKLGNTSTTSAATTNHFISFETSGIGIVGSIKGNGDKNIAYATNGIADFAEHMKKDENEIIEWGSLVCVNTEGNVESCNNHHPSTIVGVASEYPTFVGGKDLGNKSITVGLSGIVMTQVSNHNGNIHAGDIITSSTIPGVGVKSKSAGQGIGIALADYSSDRIGKIYIRVAPTWYDPDTELTDTGEFSIAAVANNNFEVKRNNFETIKRIGAFSEIMVGKVKGGYFELGRLTVTTADITFSKIGELTVNTAQIAFAQIETLSTDSLAVATENISIAGIGIRDYIYSIVDERITDKKIAISSPISETDIIRPKTGKTLAIKLPTNNKESKFEIRNASDSAVASIDAEGNASLAGTLTSAGVQTNEASISGTLRAGRIIADQIDISEETLAKIQGININASPSANYITNNYYYNSTSSAETNYDSPNGGNIAALPGITADYGTFTNGLMSFGPTSFFEATIAERLFVGSQLSIADGSINVLGKDLEIQSLRQGGIAFVGGEIKIDIDGNLKVGGNAYFAKNAEVNGTLMAGIIAPIPGKDLVFEFKDLGESSNNSSVEFRTGTGSAVLSFNNKGDVKASGSGTFNKLNLSFIPKAIAVSDTEVIATGSAGTAEIKPYKNEITINNKLVTKDSLIYITPKTGTPNQSVYLLRQVPGESFTVGLSKAISKPVPFNWILIN